MENARRLPPERTDPQELPGDRYRLAEEVQPHGVQDQPTVDAAGDRLSVGIAGVRHCRLASQVDHRGSLTEVVNFDNPFWDEPVLYSYCFTIQPGRIKAWGMHKLQADRYFIAAGHVRVVLYDGRTRSPTFERFAEFHLTEDSRGLLLIPPGVWHGDQNYGTTEAALINFPTRPFDRDRPDKYRIDPHSGAIPFEWSLPDA
ncbi:MAG: dTDP-4-dehydrorhamnose 3,5-epimerase family protein [Solirubrobacterales bacterium]|nr:dTDP-4-dehydrorhamnose 3,5-epimerase family protein [Solirubrobacterales bacterium]